MECFCVNVRSSVNCPLHQGSLSNPHIVYTRRFRNRPSSFVGTVTGSPSASNFESYANTTPAPPPLTEQETAGNQPSGEQEPDPSLSGFEEVESYSEVEEQIEVADAPLDMVLGLPSGDGPVGLTLTDSSVLDCPVCYYPLKIPVYQCANGHIVCKPCWKMAELCALCRIYMGNMRCRAIERVLESVETSCRFLQLGCPDIFVYANKRDHEKFCNFTPCACPYTDCKYVGTSKNLYNHFDLHSNSTKQFLFNSTITLFIHKDEEKVFLQERNEKTLFVLYNTLKPDGNVVTLVCVSPKYSRRVFRYELSSSRRNNEIKLHSFAKNVPDRILRIHDEICMIPRDFLRKGMYRMEVKIRSH